MFGLSIIKTKKLDSIIQTATNLSLENLTLTRRISEAKGLAEHAMKRHDYIKGTNRTETSKGQNYRRILAEFIESIRHI